jgi:predicted esterase
MRAPAVTAAMRALWHGALAVTLGGLLQACANDQAISPGEEATGGGASGGTASVAPGAPGGAAGSSIAGTGWGGAAGVGAGGVGDGYGTGGAAAVGTGGGFGTGGVGEVGGTGGVGAGGTGGPSGTGGSAAAVNVVCNPIVAGPSTVMVNGAPRTFSVQLPRDTSHMALLFLWHGFMQNPTDFANAIVYDVPSGHWVAFDPNAFPMPLMIVTPYDTKLIPPVGLDWDIASGAKALPFFDAMLQCIQQEFNIDKTRTYSFGFSAGAVFTNLLSAKYPHLFAATISESGTWFNDQTEWSDVSVPIMQWQWPAFDAADRGNVLLTHGGPNDFATVISLESANHKALPYLYNNGRTVTECAHTFGHALDPDLTQSMYYEYMWAHKLGGPPLSGMIPSFPTTSHPIGPTFCTFHPAP